MADRRKIDKVSERMVLTEAGELQKIYHIQAITAKGIIFSMDIPEDETQPELVKEILGRRAGELDTLLAL